MRSQMLFDLAHLHAVEATRATTRREEDRLYDISAELECRAVEEQEREAAARARRSTATASADVTRPSGHQEDAR